MLLKKVLIEFKAEVFCDGNRMPFAGSYEIDLPNLEHDEGEGKG
jgi:hypothetical protein